VDAAAMSSWLRDGGIHIDAASGGPVLAVPL
jgi:hypothetical protein